MPRTDAYQQVIDRGVRLAMARNGTPIQTMDVGPTPAEWLAEKEQAGEVIRCELLRARMTREWCRYHRATFMQTVQIGAFFEKTARLYREKQEICEKCRACWEQQERQ